MLDRHAVPCLSITMLLEVVSWGTRDSSAPGNTATSAIDVVSGVLRMSTLRAFSVTGAAGAVLLHHGSSRSSASPLEQSSPKHLDAQTCIFALPDL